MIGIDKPPLIPPGKPPPHRQERHHAQWRLSAHRHVGVDGRGRMAYRYRNTEDSSTLGHMYAPDSTPQGHPPFLLPLSILVFHFPSSPSFFPILLPHLTFPPSLFITFLSLVTTLLCFVFTYYFLMNTMHSINTHQTPTLSFIDWNCLSFTYSLPLSPSPYRHGSISQSPSASTHVIQRNKSIAVSGDEE